MTARCQRNPTISSPNYRCRLETPFRAQYRQVMLLPCAETVCVCVHVNVVCTSNDYYGLAVALPYKCKFGIEFSVGAGASGTMVLISCPPSALEVRGVSKPRVQILVVAEKKKEKPLLPLRSHAQILPRRNKTPVSGAIDSHRPLCIGQRARW